MKTMKKTIIVSLFKDKETNKYVADVTGEESENKREFRTYDASKYEKIESKEFEVDDDVNWSLAENTMTNNNLDSHRYSEYNVKKCRDLIIQDMLNNYYYCPHLKDERARNLCSKLELERYENSRCRGIVKKRFGDL